MDADFWQHKWESGEIGFHGDRVHPLLETLWPTLAPDREPVFVPLCGKSLDLAWLADQGHDVVGCELSALAIADFFRERGADPRSARDGPLVRHAAGPYVLYCGDFFDLATRQVGHCRIAYDRAALVALPPASRQRYVDALYRLLAPGSRLLLISLTHAGGPAVGPPFSVDETEMPTLFKHWSHVKLLKRHPALLRGEPISEWAYRIDR